MIAAIIKELRNNRFKIRMICFIVIVLICPVSNLQGSMVKQTGGNELNAVQSGDLRVLMGINEEQTLKMETIIRNFYERRSSLNNTLNHQIDELKSIIDKADEKMLKSHISRIDATIKALQELNFQKWETLKKLLSEKQQARYLIYQNAMQKALRKRAATGFQKTGEGVD